MRTLTLGALLLPQGLAAQADSGLAVRAIRFFSPETRQTRVTAFVRIPYGRLTVVPDASGAPGHLRFGLTVRVLTDAGDLLYEQQWPKRVPPPEPGRMNGLDMIRFPLDGGTYLLEAEVEDSGTGLTERARTTVQAWGTSPGVSDLLLSADIRPATAGDTIPRPGTVRRGSLLLEAAAEVLIPTSAPVVHYMFETYMLGSAQGEIVVRVLDQMGEVILTEPPVPIETAEGMSTLRGQIRVPTLRPGSYALRALIRLGNRAFERGAAFAVIDGGVVLGDR